MAERRDEEPAGRGAGVPRDFEDQQASDRPDRWDVGIGTERGGEKGEKGGQEERTREGGRRGRKAPQGDEPAAPQHPPPDEPTD
ncbi:hypothetical protein GCM10010218_56920 [Streptomyces mashuensis]|uniref:Uncharacterized protein n=1 Tax=Streptomyces mashuensis TaxID=33904 RepID=A0A919EFU3_9ACTN|nr:hypothetical protein [Streptomyces mashuensis]GHF68006.1 hypothetical protein GCM10010218_56920 [Streptomyces mashuensis]